MGGEKERNGNSVITKKSLVDNLMKTYSFFSSIDNFPGDMKGAGLSKSMLEEEADEILKYLSTSSSDSLSLKDFVNAISLETGSFSSLENRFFQ